VVDARPLSEGRRNTNFDVHLDGGEHLVVRVCEHDRSLCAKELYLLDHVRGRVPVPDVIHAEPDGFEDLPPVFVMRLVEGMTLRDLKRSGNRAALADAVRSVGETLAEIGRTTFPAPGWLGPRLAVGAPLADGPDPTPRFVEACLESPRLGARVAAELRDQARALVWAEADRLAALDRQSSLVHGDINRRNLLVRPIRGRWAVCAVLDWEFAVSGSPLVDVANFLRYERRRSPRFEPHFSAGYLEAGGELPEDWQRLARVVDLTASCESLTREELPPDVVSELVELVRATVEDRDPEL
jgi:aminoglycoside phosphotransferase (APT) family kinase protein